MSSISDTIDNEKNISVCIIHIGYRDYLKTNLEITGKNNKIYLLGDKSLKPLGNLQNVTFVDIDKYMNNDIITNYKKHFVNYSSNNSNLEWLCFSRVFILKFFFQDYNIHNIFHMDSDNILLKDINEYKFEKKIAYCIPGNSHEYRMSNSIHCGLLNMEFCNKFEELYNDIYINKTKFNLIKNKIKYHTDKSGNFKVGGGGICDMTVYYLLNKEKLIDVDNLLIAKNINDVFTVFINNVNNEEGSESKKQYMKDNNLNIMKIINYNNNTQIYDIINKKYYNLFNIHFQGGSKRFLNDNLKKSIHY